VLPFSNISDDPKQEYFVDGMTETLITDLSKLSHLYVSSRNAVFAYKGETINMRQAADELGVLYLLEGSVQISGNRVRINAQLIDAYGGGHIWAERYDGVRDDVFALQDEVTRQIVSALAVQLTPRETKDLRQKETKSVAAYDEFQRGWALYQRSTPTDLAAAMPHFERAIEKDPHYSRAHAVLAAIYQRAWSQKWTRTIDLSSEEALKRAHDHLAGAMKPPTPLAHQVASALHYFAGEHDRSIEEADRAIALAPEDPGGYFAMAKALIYASRAQEGIENLYTAMELEPENPPEYLVWLGMGRFFSESFEQAALSLERASKLLPEDINTHLLLVATYGYLGRLADVDRTLTKLNKIQVKSGSATSRFNLDSWPLKEDDDRERLREGIRLAGASG
jgi:TolB-like protein